MYRLIGLGLGTLFLAACNQSAQPSPSDAAATNQAVTPVDAPVAGRATFSSDLPAGIQLPFEYSIRSRAVENNADGRLRRLVIEFKQGDVPTIDRQIEELLLAKGYRRYRTLERGKELVGDYGDSGKRVTVTTTPANGKLQLSPGSLGTVYFVWNE